MAELATTTAHRLICDLYEAIHDAGADIAVVVNIGIEGDATVTLRSGENVGQVIAELPAHWI